MVSPDEWPMGVGDARAAHLANRADARVAEVDGGEAALVECALRTPPPWGVRQRGGGLAVGGSERDVKTA